MINAIQIFKKEGERITATKRHMNPNITFEKRGS